MPKEMKHIALLVLLFSGHKIFSQPQFAITTNGELYSIDLNQCASQLIGETGLSFADIAFTPDGILWAVVDSSLYKVDTTTANAVLIGSSGIHGLSLVALNDSTLLTESGLNLYGIRTSDGSSYYIDTIGYFAAGDLTWYDNDLYLTASFTLVKMTLNSAHTDIISVTALNDVSLPTITAIGATTAAFSGTDNSIIGYSGRQAFKMCQLDGSFKLLCDFNFPDNIAGGASTRLPVQLPEPFTCNFETAVNDLVQIKSEIQIHPNPASPTGHIFIPIRDHFSFPFTVRLFNMEGKTFFYKTIASSTSPLDVDLSSIPLTSGLYGVELKSANQWSRSVLVID